MRGREDGHHSGLLSRDRICSFGSRGSGNEFLAMSSIHRRITAAYVWRHLGSGEDIWIPLDCHIQRQMSSMSVQKGWERSNGRDLEFVDREDAVRSAVLRFCFSAIRRSEFHSKQHSLRSIHHDSVSRDMITCADLAPEFSRPVDHVPLESMRGDDRWSTNREDTNIRRKAVRCHRCGDLILSLL